MRVQGGKNGKEGKLIQMYDMALVMAMCSWGVIPLECSEILFTSQNFLPKGQKRGNFITTSSDSALAKYYSSGEIGM